MSTVSPQSPPIPRVFTFTDLFLKEHAWDGPNPQGEFLTYTSKTDNSTLIVDRGTAVGYHLSYGAGQTIFVFADSIYLPEGAKRIISGGL
jgi:hypothetical protein